MTRHKLAGKFCVVNGSFRRVVCSRYVSSCDVGAVCVVQGAVGTHADVKQVFLGTCKVAAVIRKRLRKVICSGRRVRRGMRGLRGMRGMRGLRGMRGMRSMRGMRGRHD